MWKKLHCKINFDESDVEKMIVNFLFENKLNKKFLSFEPADIYIPVDFNEEFI